MRARRTVLLFALALAGLSCSLFKPKVAPYPSGAIFPVEEIERLNYEGKIIPPILKTDGNLYFSTDSGQVYCLESSARQVLWKYTAGALLSSQPIVGDDCLSFLDQGGVITCLDKSGKLRWKSQVKGNSPLNLSQDGQGIYVGTREGNFLALSLSSGDVLWQLPLGGAIFAAAVFWRDVIIVGSADGKLTFLDHRGKKRTGFDLGGPVLVTPLVDEDRLYVGTEDATFHCLDLSRIKRKWRIKAGGRILGPPRTDEKRIFFIASNCVLYALNKKGGDILWWKILPSRSSYRLEFSDRKILVASSSPLLVCLNRETGREEGNYDAGSELRSNPLWLDPYLLVNIHDFKEKKGSLIYLSKQVKIRLTASLSSPQPAGTEITFNASTVGFYHPRFEFFRREGEGRSVIQPASERNSWVWFADKEGKYSVGVKVTDEKQEKEIEIPFEIAGKAK